MQSNYVNAELRKKVIDLKDIAAQHFTLEHWLELAILTSSEDIIRGHDRLLRSLRFGDEDYPACVLDVFLKVVGREEANFEFIQNYIAEKFGLGGVNASSASTSAPRVYFQPTVFQVPSQPLEPTLISVMMPFDAPLSPVYESIKAAAAAAGFQCQRADDIWQHSTVIQDVFSLIYRSYIVVCDFTGRNANVFYEAGIAHTLGKHVVPITQSKHDIPFDLQHHRYVPYLNNNEGRAALEAELTKRFEYLDANRT